MLLFYGASVSRVGQEFLWNYFKENMPELATKFGGVGSCLFQRCLKLAIERQCREEFAQEVENFFCHNLNSEDLQILERPIKQATESVRLNKFLLESNITDVDGFLTSRGF
ncbi:hypothetical protein KIN20_020986 [Parelaphostrongylus tenuis]|uniref:ERAP1-like C-terminal domain-containing protein n=1 Tax=Parelaphostrongylus tenuis TaxID=148309 RepID=A0AAD5MNA1_PARTN|nr:hypothetical protein KIN20_020986 [Parelaphostrongylus tenuis]